ncbi:unnamed protein product [Diatraea saccharalis]|uniref:DUF4455 domain-containing protein n=1 Tax=Diatraea saccharalis TaxID=40085 RepID=A0A9N9QSZ7_9NEOP|nr:unnamed protein product [Diatraea saccharalis]
MPKVTSVTVDRKYCCRNRQKNKIKVALPGCTDDDLAVATLPDNWVPRCAGPILTNYLNERKQNHETVQDKIEKEALVINNTIDTKIRTLAENLLSHIKHHEQTMNCVVENLDDNNDSQGGRNYALTCVSKLYSQRVNELASFKRESLALERQRADKIRKLLQEQFQRLISVGHLPPRDLLHEFDQQVYEINQQLLSNSRAYAELEAQLLAQLDEQTVEVKSNINQICLGFHVEAHNHSAHLWRREEKIPQRQTASASISKDDVAKQSISHIIGEVHEFDECVSLLVEAYRMAVIKILTGFTGKLSDLYSHVCSISFLETGPKSDIAMDLQNIIDRISKRLAINLLKRTSNLPELVEKGRLETLEMQKSLWSLGERLRDTYNILHDSAHLWDAHMVRSALAQKLTIACVEDLFTSNDSIELANEVNFNISLEQLRSAPDTDKLQQQYDIVLTMLDRISDVYTQHAISESDRLECFMSFPEAMANILMSEYQCFLDRFPRASIPVSDTGIRQSVTSPRMDVNSLQMPLPRAILQTELQGVYLLNWRNGFLETFANNISNLREELINHARIWVDEKARTLHMRHSMKLISHSIRKERIKAAYDVRLSELRYHDARLNSHLSAVYELVDSLPLEAAEYLSLDDPELYPFCKWVDGIHDNVDTILAQDQIDLGVKKLKMCSYALRLVKHRALFENSLDATIETCKRQIENRIQEARISNIRLASQFKLHSEGGRYSAQEATRACTLLMKGADAIESCLSRAIDALNHRRSQLLLLADQKLQPIQKIVDEFAKPAKHAVKNVADKRKPATGKK